MRILNSNIQTAIENKSITPQVAVRIEFSNTSIPAIYATDAPYNFNFQDTEYGDTSEITYNANIGLLEIQAPRIGTIIDNSIYTLVFSDSNKAIKNRFDINYVAAKIRAYLFFIDMDHNTVKDNDGNIIYFDVYTGLVDKVASEVKGNEFLTSIECSNPFVNLDGVKSVFTNKNSNRSVWPNDSSMDAVSIDDGETSLKWGKA